MKRSYLLAVSLIMTAGLWGCGSSPSQTENSASLGQTMSEAISKQSSASVDDDSAAAAPTTPGASPETTCPPQSAPQTSPSQPSVPQASSPQQSAPQASSPTRDSALAAALANAGVPQGDAYNVKIEQDGDNSIPIFDIEFETDYGDYDFEISMTTGEIVGADYEVDEEYLDTLGGSPVSIQEAVSIVQSKIPGSPAEDIRIWEESDDGRGRYEGELFFNNIKYEFEIDPPTGIIFDWNADLRL